MKFWSKIKITKTKWMKMKSKKIIKAKKLENVLLNSKKDLGFR